MERKRKNNQTIGRREFNLKKVHRHFHKRPATKIGKYQFIRDNVEIFGVVKMCKTLEVSRSGFYNWKNRKLSKRKAYNILLLTEIKRIHKESEERYGSPKIYQELLSKGYSCSKKLVEKLMKIGNIRSKIVKRFTVVTTNSNHSATISPNLLNREFKASKPGKVWCSDITYIEIDSRWFYLTMIIDLFNREIVGWDLSESLEAKSLLNCFEKAILLHQPKPGCIFHSDRGIQFASKEFRNKITEHKMKQSMSRKGDCWDNAVAESFFKTLKNELIRHVKFKNIDQAKQSLFEYIEIFYNRKRIHSTLGFTSPVDFRKLYEQRAA
ncbi:IS3 family transposase [Leptospira soteropolitanensis]|uniref:IS3 family transposase n=1 Tax=Leptospira soteropolitanensis TaxID=2950025 RepID=UPI002AC85C40|nr:IS3 family transposase [Leptospira soteropolitanensis]